MLTRSRLMGLLALSIGAIACGQTGVAGPTSSASGSSSSGGGMGGMGGATSSSGSGSTGGMGGATSSSGAGGASNSSSSGGASTSSSSGASSSSSGGTGGGGGIVCGAGAPAAITNVGQGSLLLQGTVVTPDQVFAGEVLITGDTITCAAASCAGSPGFATATVVDTHGIILPGLIDTHNHILFDIFDETHWAPLQSYNNHNQWTNEARYGAMVDAKQYLNGEGSSPVDFGCEMNKYGELKGLVAGTTSIVGAANPANRACYGTLARTIDQTPNGLGADKIQVATLFPSTASADGVCSNVTTDKTDAYLIHIAEGVDQTALNEFTTLGTVTTTDGCLYASTTTIVHGTALGDPGFSLMAQNGMSLVWSPRSNVFLYGGGVDFTKTTDIPLALSKGINVALAPDWSMGGSQNLLDELRFADMLDNAAWGNLLTPQMLTQMVTTHAAKALGLDAKLGSIEAGKKADLLVIGGDPCMPYDALLATTPAEVRLVLVGGVPLYGDAALKPLGPVNPGCEDLDVCGTAKFVCVAAPSLSPTDKFGQTFAAIQSTLNTELAVYDALDLSAWDFAPITPLVRCP